MTLFEKYKLYRNVIKQKPNNVIIHMPYIIYNTDDYKIDTMCIRKQDLINIKPNSFKTRYYAYVSKKDEKGVITFESLLAKRLFEYGKQYQK